MSSDATANFEADLNWVVGLRVASWPGQDLLTYLLKGRSERLPVAECRSMYLKLLWCPWPDSNQHTLRYLILS